MDARQHYFENPDENEEEAWDMIYMNPADPEHQRYYNHFNTAVTQFIQDHPEEYDENSADDFETFTDLILATQGGGKGKGKHSRMMRQIMEKNIAKQRLAELRAIRADTTQPTQRREEADSIIQQIAKPNIQKMNRELGSMLEGYGMDAFAYFGE
jgi:hypothetical protein